MKVSNKVLVEIPVADLEIGMYVSKLDCPWEETPFIYQGFYLYDKQDIQELQALCKTVFVQAEKEVWEEKQKVTLSTGKERVRTVEKQKITYINKVPAYRELEKAGATFNEAKRLISNIFATVKLGRSFNISEVKSVVTDIVGSILRNPNAMQWLSLIKNKDEYTAEHCLRVCVFAVSLGRELGMLEGELIELGISGFLHDVGKTRIPNEVLNKPGRFTAQEFELMKSHSTHGKNILISQAGVPPIAVDVAYTHHERIDGGGYPRKLEGYKISRFARIVCIVDAYDAMTSVRVYKSAMSSLESLRIIFEEKGVHFDPELADLFIKLIGVYPTGHIAELTSGEVGIIIKSNNEHRLKPKILRLIDKHGIKSKEVIIDLAKTPTDDNGNPIRLKDVHPNGAFGIDIQPYLKKGLRLSEAEE
ncbi:HD-GYP domain-containing protein [Alkalimarinus coralli]|uniref:HD-GYP domain-containing protein n=1 Tax=Alkalimarinus coralli TaxID=2935863 RepID=UPI00202B1E17|nr:HD-GYP domain-containing protein [Alkalimarinus coralli]